MVPWTSVPPLVPLLMHMHFELCSSRVNVEPTLHRVGLMILICTSTCSNNGGFCEESKPSIPPGSEFSIDISSPSVLFLVHGR